MPKESQKFRILGKERRCVCLGERRSGEWHIYDEVRTDRQDHADQGEGFGFCSDYKRQHLDV